MLALNETSIKDASLLFPFTETTNDADFFLKPYAILFHMQQHHVTSP